MTVVDEKTGKEVTKTISPAEMNKYRLELARKLDAEKYKDERTVREDGVDVSGEEV